MPARYLAAMLLAALLAAPACAEQQSNPPETAQLVRVIDGDSLLVRHGSRETQVRLIGLDAPEWNQPYGQQAEDWVVRHCPQGSRLHLRYDQELRDRYDRLLAYVTCRGRFLNLHLVKSGLAKAKFYKPNGKHQRELKQAMETAKKAKKGMWE
ncbi:thermonuclease family protein [Desulfohalovibrio reitneri]|uniref:thermonuclease family protein n=1 Tax=Desulfohalovibrio reitneri TaxID=1307759 RepID=UPI0006896083|nr:thermonuclease family protein [Desulfohalovibrio reitneri]